MTMTAFSCHLVMKAITGSIILSIAVDVIDA